MKNEFLYASIADTQGTIRSIDIRAGFLFIILFMPLSIFDKISAIHAHSGVNPPFMVAGMVVVLVAWTAALCAIFRCILGVDNPTSHVFGTNAAGSFYSGDLFSLGILDVFMNLRVTSSRSIDEEKARLPKNDDEIQTELVFERMKLAYIRAVKMKRFMSATWLTFFWLVLSFSLIEYMSVS